MQFLSDILIKGKAFLDNIVSANGSPFKFLVRDTNTGEIKEKDIDIPHSQGEENNINIADGNGGLKSSSLELSINVIKPSFLPGNDHCSLMLNPVGAIGLDTNWLLLSTTAASLKSLNDEEYIPGSDDSLVTKKYVDDNKTNSQGEENEVNVSDGDGGFKTTDLKVVFDKILNKYSDGNSHAEISIHDDGILNQKANEIDLLTDAAILRKKDGSDYKPQSEHSLVTKKYVDTNLNVPKSFTRSVQESLSNSIVLKDVITESSGYFVVTGRITCIGIKSQFFSYTIFKDFNFAVRILAPSNLFVEDMYVDRHGGIVVYKDNNFENSFPVPGEYLKIELAQQGINKVFRITNDLKQFNNSLLGTIECRVEFTIRKYIVGEPDLRMEEEFILEK